MFARALSQPQLLRHYKSISAERDSSSSFTPQTRADLGTAVAVCNARQIVCTVLYMYFHGS